MRTEEPTVIWVGPTGSAAFGAIREAIQDWGIQIANAPTAEDLPGVVDQYVRPIVLVCDETIERRSRTVLASLGQYGRRVPIFVVTEQSDFGDYYYLMNEGAQCYYQLNEGPERISRAVNWVAMSCTA